MNKKIDKQITLTKIVHVALLLLSGAAYGMKKASVTKAEFMSPNNRWWFPAKDFMDPNKKWEQPRRIEEAEDDHLPWNFCDQVEESVGGSYYFMAPAESGETSMRIPLSVMRAWGRTLDAEKKIAEEARVAAERQRMIEERDHLRKEKEWLDLQLAAVEQAQHALGEKRGVKRKARELQKYFGCAYWDRPFTQEGSKYRHEETEHPLQYCPSGVSKKNVRLDYPLQQAVSTPFGPQLLPPSSDQEMSGRPAYRVNPINQKMGQESKE